MDLDKQQWIQTDAEKHEYYVMTFQQMSDMMARAEEMMKTPPPATGTSKTGDTQVQTETTVDVSEEHPGTTKDVAGYTATEHIFKATVKTTMKGTPAAGAPATGAGTFSTTMLYTQEVWVLDTYPPAYQAVIDFYKRAGEKMESVMSPAARAAMPQGIPNTPGTQNGMQELQRRVAALKGLHVIEVTRLGMTMNANGETATLAPATAAPATPAPAPAANGTTTSNAQSTANSVASGATNSAAQSAVSKFGGIGGALARGGLGGFGARKPATPPPAAAPAGTPAATPAPVAAAQTVPAAAGNPFLSETTIEMSNFSTQPVVLLEFEVPAGYKQVESPIERMLKTPAK
jgi:hypothetical protein